jgi:hypothetical protein
VSGRAPMLGEIEEKPDHGHWGRPGGSMFSTMPVIGSAGCWCGAPGAHDWPGRSEGAPHPRDMEFVPPGVTV